MLKVFRISAAKNNEGKLRRRSRNMSNSPPVLIGEEGSSGSSENPTTSSSLEANGDAGEKAVAAPRSDILQACTLTSGLLFALGLVLRQVKLSLCACLVLAKLRLASFFFLSAPNFS